MDPGQLREYIVRPALKSIDMHSAAAEELVMGTAAQESRLIYVHQIGGGPAVGLFQMEPRTHKDIWKNYLAYKASIYVGIYEAIDYPVGTPEPHADRLIWDMRYAAIMCRVHYRRVKQALPDENDVWGLAEYWKKHYNTIHGAGTVEEFVENYRLIS